MYNYNQKYISYPHCIHYAARSIRKHKPDFVDMHYIHPPYINETNNEFYSRLFLIRYVEEACYIGEIFCLRLEVENYSASSSIPLLVEADLLFCDLSQLGGVSGISAHIDNVNM
jgi:hypothetical protein